MDAEYYRYWGKAKPVDEATGVLFHLLPYHCLDVAAVADQWWQHSSVLRQQFKNAIQTDENTAYAWLMFFIALHDLGKLDVRFQIKSPETLQSLQQIQSDIFAILKKINGKYDHGSNGYGWFEKEAIDYGFDFNAQDLANDWMQQVAGHHGRIPENESLIKPAFIEAKIIQQDKHARIEWVQSLEQLFLVPTQQCLSDVPERMPSMLAGFCSICDWIGSSEFFPYQNQIQLDLKAYFESRLINAKNALKSNAGMAELFPHYKPQGLQTLVDSFPVKQGLTIIEAPTGSGKTEAALAYASKLLNNFAGSIIFALPTQATANAMLKRLEDVADKIFTGGANVVLAHGKRDFNDDFKKILAHNQYTTQGAEEAGVQCSQWLGASKKRAFLGQIGVCTIDQVLLSVLPIRHQFIRGFGVQKSILIIDEVHAYDSYMYGLLTAVLERQKQAGGSVILLSATLPQHQKQTLLESWGINEENTKAAYPLVTHASNQIITFDLPDSEQSTERIVAVETWQADQLVLSNDQLQQIVQAAEQGVKVAVICNLVTDAQNIAKQLTELTSIPVDLFHSRYRFIDRQVIEQNISSYYGKINKHRAIGGRILVATQVVEQSLDLDFDWLITQICPVDLLFQRIGRLHRHLRDDRPQAFKQPCCVVIVPTTEAAYGDTRFVYQNLRALWRTEQFLKNTEIVFKSHQDELKTYTAYRDWIERVYCEKAWGDEPEIVEKAYLAYLNDKVDVPRMKAKTVVKWKIAEIQSDESDNAGLLTRDGEMSITVVLATLKKEKLFSLDGLDLNNLEKWQYWEAISLNSVSVSNRWQDQLPKANANGVRFLNMVMENDFWVCHLQDISLFYSEHTGLTIENG